MWAVGNWVGEQSPPRLLSLASHLKLLRIAVIVAMSFSGTERAATSVPIDRISTFSLSPSQERDASQPKLLQDGHSDHNCYDLHGSFHRALLSRFGKNVKPRAKVAHANYAEQESSKRFEEMLTKLEGQHIVFIGR